MGDPVYTWPKDEKAVRALDPGKHFATIDPGADGVALAFAPPALWTKPMRPLVLERIRHYRGAVRFAHRCVRHGAANLIIERAYVGKNASSGLKTSRTAGYAQGAFAYATASFDPAIIEIAPQTWQSAALDKTTAKREGRKAAAVAKAEKWMDGDPRWHDAGKEQRSAIADALGMAEWWVRLHYPDTEIFDDL